MLLIRTSPFSDEALESYLYRLSENNGNTKITNFWGTVCAEVEKLSLKHCNLPLNIEDVNPCYANVSSVARIRALHYVCQLTNQEPLPVMSLALYRGKNEFAKNYASVFKNGISIPRIFLTKIVKVCPACLTEDNYVRQHWFFKHQHVCPKHEVILATHCKCRDLINSFNNKTINQCLKCQSNYADLPLLPCKVPNDVMFSKWLNQYESTLPDVKLSHRWGLVLWWQLLNKQKADGELDTADFVKFMSNWPASFEQRLKDKMEHAEQYGLIPFSELSFKDVFDDLLMISTRLPSSQLSENIVLKAIFSFIADNLLADGGSLLSLKVSCIEAAILLNTTTEQVIVLHEQGELQANVRLKSRSLLNINQSVFELGDIFCLWQAKFQTEYSNISIFASKW